MSVLLLFLDGVGLGEDDPDTNPFARAEMPVLTGLLGGRACFGTRRRCRQSGRCSSPPMPPWAFRAGPRAPPARRPS